MQITVRNCLKAFLNASYLFFNSSLLLRFLQWGYGDYLCTLNKEQAQDNAFHNWNYLFRISFSFRISFRISIRNWLIFIPLQFCIWLYWLVETDEETKGTDIMVLGRKYWCLFLFFLMLYLWNCFLFTIFYCLWEFILKLGYTIHAETLLASEAWNVHKKTSLFLYSFERVPEWHSIIIFFPRSFLRFVKWILSSP